MKLPTTIVPLLEEVSRQYREPLEFWAADHPDLIDAYYGLAAQITLSNIQLELLPRGYSLLATIFDWESNCLMSGWYAIANRASKIESIASAFKEVGLESESRAVVCAANAWFATDGDSKATGKAYSGVPNEYRDETDRTKYLIHYFHKNSSKLFYEKEK